MSLEKEDINWILDLVTNLENDIKVMNYRLSQIEHRLNIHSKDRGTILRLLQGMDVDIESNNQYLSNLSKEIVTLREQKLSNKRIKYK